MNNAPQPMEVAMTKREALSIVGSLSRPSKMPSLSWSISPDLCSTGGKLAEVEGSVCSNCYAKKGNYQRYSKMMARCWDLRLAGYHSPQWEDAMATLISGAGYFRWFDAGDLQSLEMLERIAAVAERTPNTRHWLPTKEYAIVRWYELRHGEFPPNLVVRVSGPMVDGPPPHTSQPTTTVHTGDTPNHGIECGAYTRKGKCGDCRRCWDRSVKNVSYRNH